MKDSRYKYLSSFDGAKICYDSQILDNDDFVFVFLHGFGGDMTAWGPERKKLREMGFSSIACDMRGHGLSSRSDNGDFYEFINFCKDIVYLIKEEKIKRPVLVGHCFGGMISILTEYYFPGTAEAMILIDTSSKPPFFAKPFTHSKLAYKLLGLIARHAPNVRFSGHVDFSKFINTADFDTKRLLSDILHVSIRTYLLIIEKLVKYDSEAYLGQLNIPVQIIEGENDTIFPPATAELLNSRIRDSRISLIPNANHIIVTNNPREVVDEMVKFAKEVFK